MNLRCPVCGEQLNKAAGSFVCARGHSFDVARQGYVNLLTVDQKHSLHPGDTRQQVLSRREFLEGGSYAPIVSTLIEEAQSLSLSGELLDVGCGEGYYAARLSQALHMNLTGLDISKEAVRCAAGKYKNAQWLCATAAHIPVEDESADLLTSLFALTLPEEFRRMTSIPIRFSFTVKGQQVKNLFSMTPHVFRVSKAGAERLEQTELLTDTASCVLNVFVRL